MPCMKKTTSRPPADHAALLAPRYCTKGSHASCHSCDLNAPSLLTIVTSNSAEQAGQVGSNVIDTFTMCSIICTMKTLVSVRRPSLLWINAAWGWKAA